MALLITLTGLVIQIFCFAVSDALEQPFFTAHPSGTTVIDSNRHTISCQATGTMPIDYGWEINDTVIYSPAWSSNSYTFRTIGKSNIGVYRCVASNVVGTVISRGAEIHVAYFEAYGGAPQTTMVSAGDAKILTCPPYDSYPIPTVTWQFNGTDIVLGPDQLVTADQRLVLLQATSERQGSYTCNANNNVYGATQTSPSVMLTVQGTFTPPAFIAPTLVLPPSNTVVRPGQSFVQMECIISAQ